MERFHYFSPYFVSDFGVICEIIDRFISALCKFFAVIRVPCAALLNETVVYAEIEYTTFVGNTFTVDDIEFRRFKRGRNLVFNDFGFRMVTVGFAAFF